MTRGTTSRTTRQPNPSQTLSRALRKRTQSPAETASNKARLGQLLDQRMIQAWKTSKKAPHHTRTQKVSLKEARMKIQTQICRYSSKRSIWRSKRSSSKSRRGRSRNRETKPRTRRIQLAPRKLQKPREEVRIRWNRAWLLKLSKKKSKE